MEITLITSANSDEVHGTDNDKRTGCGINLLKAENVTRYRRSGVMNDLKEITCEKCKNVLAKRIIKADKKEMTRLIKEEKARAKKGIEDENIVPLGNTVAKITRSPEEIKAEEERILAEKIAAEKAEAEKKEAERKAAEAKAEAEKKAAEEEAARAAASAKTIPGTGIAIDSDLAAFAINVPKEEESEPASNVQDDFLAQFAIQKPQDEPEEEKAAAAPVQDDFLAQFAIPSPVQEEASAPAEPVAAEEPVIEEISAPEPVMEEPVIEEITVPEPVEEEMGDVFAAAETDIAASDYAPIQSTMHYPQETEEKTAPEDNTDDDIMKMFSIGGDSESGMEVLSEVEPVETSVYDNDDAVIDVHEDEISEDDTPYDNADDSDEVIEGGNEWDYVANQLFGFEGVEMPELNAAEIVPEPTAEEPVAAEEPVIEEIAAPEPVAEEPVIEEIAAPEPVAEETASNADSDVKKYRYSTPVFADEKIEEQPAAPVQPQMTAPVQPVAPVQQPQMTAPVQPMATPIQPAAPVQPQMNVPEQQSVITVPQFAGYDMNGQPIYNYVQMQMTGYDMNGQPIFAPIQPINAPVQPQMTAPVQPAAPVQPQMTAPVQPAAPVQPTPVQPVPLQPMGTPVQQNSAYRTPTANISKIATHSHSKPIPKSFVNALANSREQGQKNLIETQGRNQMPVLDSIEDVLTQMGDEGTIKRKKEAQNVPVFEEYKTPVRNSSASKSTAKPAEPERMLTKAELKAKKKQDKIDAKFKKDLAKRGF